MTVKLFLSAITKFLLGVVLVGVLIFLPAGTFSYLGGWLLMGLLFVPMFIAGLVMLWKSPALLERRLHSRESEPTQRRVIAASGLMFAAAFVVAGLNWRFGWIVMPRWSVIAAAALFLAGYLMYAEVLRENEYLSRTIEVQQGQKVIDTGLYGIVRHPMYSATLLLFLSMPLVLGSLISLVIFLAYPAIIVRRIKDEEALLEQQLPGYRAYQNKVKYRLIPRVW